MAIVNRDLSTSEQRVVITSTIQGVATGASYAVYVVPYACALEAAAFAAYGLSGSPQVKLHNHRWTAAGATQIELGVSNLIFSVATGVSGPAAGWSGIQTLGSTLLQLAQGDVIQVETAGTNAGAGEVAVSLVVKKTADIVSALGLST